MAPDVLVEADIRVNGDVPDQHLDKVRATVGVLIGREVIFSHAQVYEEPLEGSHHTNYAYCQARNALDQALMSGNWGGLVDRGGPSTLVFTCERWIKESVDLGEVSGPKEAMQRASLKLAVLHREARERR